MGNFGYLPDTNNKIATAAFTASSAAAAYPATNVGVLPISKPWRTTGCASESMLMDFSNPISVDLIALIAHNLSVSATITVTAGTTSACSDYTADPAIAYRECDAFTLLAASRSYRYWKVAIADPTNADGFIEIGYIVIGVATRSAFNYAYGWTRTDEYENLETESEFGSPQVYELFNRKRFSLPFKNRAAADVATLAALYKTLKRNLTPLLLIPDVAVNDAYFGRLVNNPEISTPSHYSYQDTDLEFLEDSHGVLVHP
jgi:hypothetical protein